MFKSFRIRIKVRLSRLFSSKALLYLFFARLNNNFYFFFFFQLLYIVTWVHCTCTTKKVLQQNTIFDVGRALYFFAQEPRLS